MTDDELEQLKLTVKQWLFHTGSLDPTNYANELKLKFIEPREKRIETLEKQIEQLKCCQNCVHFDSNEPKYCYKGVYNCAYVCDKWALGN